MTVKRTRGHPQIDKEGPAIPKGISITPSDLADLLAINPNLSKALRQVMKERKDKGNEQSNH